MGPLTKQINSHLQERSRPVLERMSTDPLPATECRTFEEIYGNGKNLCERIFDDSFTYVPLDDPNYDTAYTMWWFTRENPNFLVTQMRADDGIVASNAYTINETDDGGIPDKCYLHYDHKPVPSSNNDTATECFPYRENNCCYPSTIASAEKINENYGPEYRWDRCGKLSPQCERFFVQEACLYECDPSAGLFRAFPPTTYDPTNDTQNEWQMKGMPIKGDYCDAWMDACRYDKFCALEDGSFFGCAMDTAADNQGQGLNETTAPTLMPTNPVLPQQEGTWGLSGGEVAAIVIGVMLGLPLIVLLLVMIYRERYGVPLFGKSEVATHDRAQPMLGLGGGGGANRGGDTGRRDSSQSIAIPPRRYRAQEGGSNAGTRVGAGDRVGTDDIRTEEGMEVVAI